MRTLLRAVRDADWLTPQRGRAWVRILAVVSLAIVAGQVWLARGGVDPLGKPLGTDFVSFWSASRLVLDGHPAAAYDTLAHAAVQGRAGAADGRYYAFFYPPAFLLICAPLALLPYVPSLAAWLGSGLAVLVACLRRVLPDRWAMLPMLVFPAVLVNAGHGQNGLLSASCFGGACVLMRRRPFLAGVCLGLLAFKPHLAVAAPVALLAARRWAAVAGAAAAALGLAGLSWAVLGTETWRGFLHVAPLARGTLERGLVEPWKMQSAFAAVRVLGGGVGVAYAAQALVAAAACAVLGRAAWRRPGGDAEVALLAVAAMLCTPFVLDYDLVCLAVPLAWAVAGAQRTGWLPWERSILLAAYVLPLVSRLLALGGAPVGPLVLFALLLAVARRAVAGRAWPQPEGGAARPVAGARFKRNDGSVTP